MNEDDFMAELMMRASQPGGLTVYPDEAPQADPFTDTSSNMQSELAQILSSSQPTGDSGLTSGQQFGGVLTQLLPLAIAAASGGGGRRLGAGAQAGLAAGGDYLKEVRKEAEERRKLNQNLGLLGVKEKFGAEKDARKKRLDLEFLPQKEKIKQDAIFDRKLSEQGAGISSGTRVNVTVPLSEQGPAMGDADVDTYRIDPAVSYQLDKYIERTNRNPNKATADNIIKNYKLEPAAKDAIAQTEGLIERVEAMTDDFAKLKEKPAFGRWIASNLPDFVPIGEDEKAYQAGLGQFALELSAILNKGRPSEKDAQAIERALTNAYTTGKAGETKLRRLSATLRLANRNTLVGRQAGDPLSPEEMKQLESDLRVFGLNDALGTLKGRGANRLTKDSSGSGPQIMSRDEFKAQMLGGR
jgi:hypothetical protein